MKDEQREYAIQPQVGETRDRLWFTCKLDVGEVMRARIREASRQPIEKR